jgi:hypothetical protein
MSSSAREKLPTARKSTSPREPIITVQNPPQSALTTHHVPLQTPIGVVAQPVGIPQPRQSSNPIGVVAQPVGIAQPRQSSRISEIKRILNSKSNTSNTQKNSQPQKSSRKKQMLNSISNTSNTQKNSGKQKSGKDKGKGNAAKKNSSAQGNAGKPESGEQTEVSRKKGKHKLGKGGSFRILGSSVYLSSKRAFSGFLKFPRLSSMDHHPNCIMIHFGAHWVSTEMAEIVVAELDRFCGSGDCAYDIWLSCSSTRAELESDISQLQVIAQKYRHRTCIVFAHGVEDPLSSTGEINHIATSYVEQDPIEGIGMRDLIRYLEWSEVITIISCNYVVRQARSAKILDKKHKLMTPRAILDASKIVMCAVENVSVEATCRKLRSLLETLTKFGALPFPFWTNKIHLPNHLSWNSMIEDPLWRSVIGNCINTRLVFEEINRNGNMDWQGFCSHLQQLKNKIYFEDWICNE